MYFKPLLLPMLAQVALTFVVMYIMYSRRIAEFKAKRINPQRADTRDNIGGKLTDSASASDNFKNLSETPILFYTAILLTLSLLIQDRAIVVLAWSYVVLRCAHSFVHVTYNRVMHRFTIFLLSSLVLFGIWIRLGWIIIQS